MSATPDAGTRAPGRPGATGASDPGTAPGSSGAELAPVSQDVPAERAQHGREVSAGTHFGALDGYRAIAALMVVVTHLATATDTVDGPLGRVMGRFDFGVPLFFLMSGFLLYRPWARAAIEGRTRPQLGRYALRRAARILPLYWVVVVTTLLVLPEVRPVSAETWWRHLLAVQIYAPPGAVEGLAQTWSLCTEIAFYVALPLIGALALGRRRSSPDAAYRRQLVVLGALALVALVWNLLATLTSALSPLAGLWLPGFLDWFAAGMLLAVLEVRGRLPCPPRLVRVGEGLGRDHVTSLVIGVAAFLVVSTPLGGTYLFTPNTAWQSLSKHLLYMVAAFFLLLPGVLGRPSRWTQTLSSRVPRLTGLISYGIFLWHLLFLRLLLAWLDIPVFTGHMLLLAVLLLPATLVVAAVTYRWVERPAQRWAHRV
ncbi:MAG: acyltransferase family protein [Frankiales bacterium]|nr:acyltransferase family protein [Frankiales bacterium]